MKILEFSIRFWKICGIYLPASSSTLDFGLSILSAFAIVSVLLLFFCLSFAYVITEQGNVDTANLFYPVMQICAILAAFGPFVSAVFVRQGFGEMVELLQQVVDKSMKDIQCPIEPTLSIRYH